MKLSEYENSGSEQLMSYLRECIIKDKELKRSISTNHYLCQPPTKEELQVAKKSFMFGNDDKAIWEWTTFNTTKCDERGIEIPNIANSKWAKSNALKRNGIEVVNVIFQSEEDVNYKVVDCKIKGNILLKKDSTFWLFLRVNSYFDRNTVVISFSNENYGNSIFASLGTFIEVLDGKEKKYNYHIFKTVQLFEEFAIPKHTDNSVFKREYFKIQFEIEDTGNENIIVTSYLNEGKAKNEIKGDFFLPFDYGMGDLNKNNFSQLFNSHRIMIAGSGTDCKVVNFKCNTYYKKDFEYIDTDKTTSCDGKCCSIF